MANEISIEQLILVADGYILELSQQKNDEQKKGCNAYEFLSKIAELILLKEQLLQKISIEDYGTETNNLYSCLLGAVANYSGASISIDPNSSTPNTIIDVTIISDGKPAWFDFYWDEMESSDEVDGARFTYINPVLDGWNPSLQTGTTLLYLGVDYDMYEGGIVRLRDGKGIYEQQSIRADNFQPYDAPPLPPPTTDYYIANDTNLKSDFSPSVGNVTIEVVLNTGTATIGAFFNVGPFVAQTVIIRTPVALTLVSGAVTINLLGGDVDNPINVALLPSPFIKIYNNN